MRNELGIDAEQLSLGIVALLLQIISTSQNLLANSVGKGLWQDDTGSSPAGGYNDVIW